MTWFLIIILIIFVPFATVFIIGMIMAATQGSNKKRRGFALVTISQLSSEERDTLTNIYVAFRNKNIEKINKIVESLDKESLQILLDICSPQNRPPEFSSGKFGDNLSWTAMETEYQKLGYSQNASKILAGIILHNYDDILNKIYMSLQNEHSN